MWWSCTEPSPHSTSIYRRGVGITYIHTLCINPSNAMATFVQSTIMQIFLKPSKPCHVGIHWRALAEHSQMSTHLPRFQSFLGFLYHFVLAKFATNSIRVKDT